MVLLLHEDLADGFADGVFVEFVALLDAAAQARIEWYFLEMEVADQATTWPAIVESLQFLKSKRLAQPH